MIHEPFRKIYNVDAVTFSRLDWQYSSTGGIGDMYDVVPEGYEKHVHFIKFKPSWTLHDKCTKWKTGDDYTYDHQFRIDFVKAVGCKYFMPMPDVLLDQYDVFAPEPFFGDNFLNGGFARGSKFPFGYLSVGYGFLHRLFVEEQLRTMRTTVSRYNARGDAKYACVVHPDFMHGRFPASPFTVFVFRYQ